MDLRFGMPVVDRDDQNVGTLDRVIVGRESREVTHVVVRTGDAVEERLLSLSEVQGSNEGRLLLYVSAAELPARPSYAHDGRPSESPAERIDESSFEGQVIGSGGGSPVRLPPDAVELGPETKVSTVDAGEGQLVGVGTTALENHLAQLELGRTGSPDFVVPIDWVGEITSGRIEVTADRSQMSPRDEAA